MFSVDATACGHVSSDHEDDVPCTQRARMPNPLEQPLAEMDMAGIFDIKWRPALEPHAADPVLAVALADGRVSLMRLTGDECMHAAQPDDVPKETAAAAAAALEPGSQVVHGNSMPRAMLHELSAAAVEPDGAMVLSLDWSRSQHDGARDVALVTSTSSGAVATLQVSHWLGNGARPGCHRSQTVSMRADPATVGAVQVAETAIKFDQRWIGHEAEAWTATWDHWQVNAAHCGTSTSAPRRSNHLNAMQAAVVYSGADDCAFKGWDLRAGTASPAFSQRKAHSAGVCCIQVARSLAVPLLLGVLVCNANLRTGSVRRAVHWYLICSALGAMMSACGCGTPGT